MYTYREWVEVKNGTRALIVFRVRIVLLFGGTRVRWITRTSVCGSLCRREKKMNRIIKKKSVWIEYNELSVSDG